MTSEYICLKRLVVVLFLAVGGCSSGSAGSSGAAGAAGTGAGAGSTGSNSAGTGGQGGLAGTTGASGSGQSGAPAGSGGAAGGSTGATGTPGVITEFAIAKKCNPRSIVKGSDGALWFNCATADIGRITTSGSITMFPTAIGAGAALADLAVGADANIWYTYVSGDGNGGVGCMSIAGLVLHTYPVTDTGGPNLIAITADGTVWFTGITITHTGGLVVGRMTADGAYTKIPITTAEVPITAASSMSQDAPTSITVGPGGSVYVTGNFSPSGADPFKKVDGNPPPYLAIFALDGTLKLTGFGSRASDGVLGSDGALWINDQNNVFSLAFKNGIIDANSDLTQGYNDHGASGNPSTSTIAEGPDHTFWITGSNSKGGNIVKFTVATKAFVHYPLPNDGNMAFDIVEGPDGKMWFTELSSVGGLNGAIASIAP